MPAFEIDRREWFKRSALAAAATLAGGNARAADPRGKAEACILLWLGGGAAQIDTFDPKGHGDGKKKPGCYYESIETALPGVHLCEHLPGLARRLERTAIVRTLHHKIIDEHGAATNLMHTGRPTSGTIAYPSIGSIVAHERGAAAPDVPPYVLIGYPNVSRGPGFLGSKAGFVYLTDTAAGPAGFTRPADVDDRRAAERKKLLDTLGGSPAGSAAGEYEAAQAEALRLAGPTFLKHFDLKSEPAKVRESYGGEFGQRCLLARRLVEAGVRFVNVTWDCYWEKLRLQYDCWDTHSRNFPILRDYNLPYLDLTYGALMEDLDQRGMLDETLVVVLTDFGRTPRINANGGRDHWTFCYSTLLAGAGIRGGTVYGASDGQCAYVKDLPVSTGDICATIYHCLGIDPETTVPDQLNRPIPIAHGGRPIREILA